MEGLAVLVTKSIDRIVHIVLYYSLTFFVLYDWHTHRLNAASPLQIGAVRMLALL